MHNNSRLHCDTSDAIVLSVAQYSNSGQTVSFLRFTDSSQLDTHIGQDPSERVISSPQSPSPTQQANWRNIHALSGNRTLNRSNPAAANYASDSTATWIGSDATGVIKCYRSDREGMEYQAQRNGNAYQLMARLHWETQKQMGGKYPNVSHKYTNSEY